MRILVLTQYFPPETGAPQNRLSALTNWLNSNGHHVEVLTGMPNYPSLVIFKGYENLKKCSEFNNGYEVHRVSLFLGGKGFINRIFTYFSFCFNAWKFAINKWNSSDFDWILCESPPLFLGITAQLIAKRFGARFWLNISDLWPESVEKLGIVRNQIILFPFYQLEKWLYKRAHFISGQTQGICQSINNTSQKNTYWYPNGISMDEITKEKEVKIPEEISRLLSKKVLLYSGNFGYAQGLEVIIETADLLKDNPGLYFLLIGNGPENDSLRLLIESKNLSNVFIFNSVPRSVLFEIIQHSFASIVPLRDIELFRGAIPSKIFEPLAFGTPVLLGVKGEAFEIFCEQSNSAWFFEPQNAESLRDVIRVLLDADILKNNKIEVGKKLVNTKFNRQYIHENLINELNVII